jgi:hypothetical protein
MRRPTRAASSPNKLNAGFSGTGVGTALIAIAQQVGTYTLPGLILVYCAPAIAIVFGVAVDQFQLWTLRIREQSVIKDARKTIESQLKDPNTSPAHKEELKSMLEGLGKEIAENKMIQVRTIFGRAQDIPAVERGQLLDAD